MASGSPSLGFGAVAQRWGRGVVARSPGTCTAGVVSRALQSPNRSSRNSCSRTEGIEKRVPHRVPFTIRTFTTLLVPVRALGEYGHMRRLEGCLRGGMRPAISGGSSRPPVTWARGREANRRSDGPNRRTWRPELCCSYDIIPFVDLGVVTTPAADTTQFGAIARALSQACTGRR